MCAYLYFCVCLFVCVHIYINEYVHMCVYVHVFSCALLEYVDDSLKKRFKYSLNFDLFE